MDTVSLDRAVDELQKSAGVWAGLSLSRRIALARELLEGVVRTADRQVQAAWQAKRIKSASPQAGEDYLSGPVIVARNLRLLVASLESIKRCGYVSLPGAVERKKNGQVMVDVLPTDRFDALLYRGFSAQVWMQPGVTAQSLPGTMGVAYRRSTRAPKVALVLGAGNVASIGPLDAVYKLFVEGQVCLLKWNPVNAYLGPIVEEAFGSLVSQGFLKMAYGGADVGAYLCQHPGIDEIHITGSDRTHDAIVFGTGKDGEENKRNNCVQNTKRITSELGNVSPVIVVPGQWEARALRFQAQNVVTQMVNNAGFNCNAAKVLVTSANWPQRAAFLDAIRDELRRQPLRFAYYPGASTRYERYMASDSAAERFGTRQGEMLPWGLIPGLNSTNVDHICFTTESFCGVTAEVPIDAVDADDFLQKAVMFANDTLWGTLNASIVIDPHAEIVHWSALERAVSDLRYGSIALNHWPALAYGLGSTTWGAYPGHTAQDIQSGTGVVHNTYLFSRPQKTVLRGPLVVLPKPAWFATNRQMRELARRMVSFEHRPSYFKLPALALSAVRG